MTAKRSPRRTPRLTNHEEGALVCAWCRQPLDYSGKGRPPRTHPGECRRLYDNAQEWHRKQRAFASDASPDLRGRRRHRSRELMDWYAPDGDEDATREWRREDAGYGEIPPPRLTKALSQEWQRRRKIQAAIDAHESTEGAAERRRGRECVGAWESALDRRLTPDEVRAVHGMSREDLCRVVEDREWRARWNPADPE